MFCVIIVCLNAGKRLNATVESVLRQTYENYELVVKDGGSTDGSVDALDAYGEDSRLHICNESGGGACTGGLLYFYECRRLLL